MKAKQAQQQITHILRHIFGDDSVKPEWQVWPRTTELYKPLLDIAVGPFNITANNYENRDRDKIEASSRHPLIEEITREGRRQNENFIENENPRCLLAIEIEHSGHCKYILGDYTNASIIGLIGVVVGCSESYARIRRVGEYIRILRDLRKAPPGFV